MEHRPELLAKLEEACELLIGAAAWLETKPCDQKMVALGLRKWVADEGLTAIAKAKGGVEHDESTRAIEGSTDELC